MNLTQLMVSLRVTRAKCVTKDCVDCAELDAIVAALCELLARRHPGMAGANLPALIIATDEATGKLKP